MLLSERLPSDLIRHICATLTVINNKVIISSKNSLTIFLNAIERLGRF